MLVIGVTGGIGSGKSAVTRRFAALGVDVIDADVVAREVVEPGTPALDAIREHFGEGVMQGEQLDRAALRQRIFSDPDAKLWLEALLHPLIGEELLRQLAAARSPYAILVSPLLVESGQHVLCQRVLVVDVPESVQLQRTMQRDTNDAVQVRRIMASQASREQRLARADDVIDNSGEEAALDGQVQRLHRRYLDLARGRSASAAPEVSP